MEKFKLNTENINNFENTQLSIKKKHSFLSIIAFICALTLILAPSALILAIIDFIVNKQKTKHVFSIIAIIISVFIIFSLIVGLTNNNSSKYNDINTLTPTVEFITEPVDTPEVTEEPTETPTQESIQQNKIYNNAEIIDIMNEFGTKKIGTASIIKASRAECTDETLIDWYFNFVNNNTDCNYHLIVYTDIIGKGIYANDGLIQKDVDLIKENDGNYELGNNAGSTGYIVNEDSKTITIIYILADEKTINNAKIKINEIIPEEYKNSKKYEIDISGEKEKLDCNLILINKEFESTKCQNIAIEIASKIKELNLGIKCLYIIFQLDDYNISAISNIDNLSTQNITENIITYNKNTNN